MKQIKLSQGKYAFVDEKNYERVMQWEWNAHHSDTGQWYAVRNDVWPSRKTIRMHRFIVNAPTGVEVDHWDGNGLHNWESNLRVATRSQNMANVGKRITNKSGYKGVSWDKINQVWRVTITVNYQQISLGRYDDLIEAAQAYDDAAIEYFGEFALLNFPRW